MIADMNGDGKPDLVTLGTTNDGGEAELAISLGNGDGTFQTPTIVDFGASSSVGFGLAVADFNGDGNLDVAVTGYDPPVDTGIFLGNGNGTVQSFTNASGGAEPGESIYLLVYGPALAANFSGSSLPGLFAGSAVLINQPSSAPTLTPTTTTLSTSTSNIAAGQSVTFTATVTASGSTPSGSVTFLTGAPHWARARSTGRGLLPIDVQPRRGRPFHHGNVSGELHVCGQYLLAGNLGVRDGSCADRNHDLADDIGIHRDLRNRRDAQCQRSAGFGYRHAHGHRHLYGRHNHVGHGESDKRNGELLNQRSCRRSRFHYRRLWRRLELLGLNFEHGHRTVQALTPGFTVGASPASGSVTAGNSAQTTIIVTPANGFNQQVSFACSGVSKGGSCSFSPQTVKPNGGAVTTTLTIATTSQSTALAPKARRCASRIRGSRLWR